MGANSLRSLSRIGVISIGVISRGLSIIIQAGLLAGAAFGVSLAAGRGFA